VELINALTIPAWSFESLGQSLSSLVGLNYEFDASPQPVEAGAALAVLALVGLAWRARSRPIGRLLWATLLGVLTLWALQALAAGEMENFPASPHYMFPVTLLVVLVIVEAARGLRLSTGALIVLFLVAAAGLGTNFIVLRDRASKFRDAYTPQARSALAGLEIAGKSADRDFAFAGLTNLDPFLFAAFVGNVGPHPTERYLESAERFGAIGYRPDELTEGTGNGSQPYRAIMTDSVLVAAEKIKAIPAERVRRTGCLGLPGRSASFPVEPGRSVVVEGAVGRVKVRRFSRLADREIGTATARRPVLIRFPVDGQPDRPWRVSVTGRSMRVCPPE
jgi:hypothetical protein